MRFINLALALAMQFALIGCHSAMIAATISNRTSQPLSLIELDYPSASFGTQELDAGKDFHYRFKLLGNGATTVLWTDAAHHDQKNSGPSLREGDEGLLTVIFTPGANPTWNLQLANRTADPNSR